MNEYYEILGIRPGASLDEVRDSYRDLVKVWHPDRFSHDPKLRAKASDKLKSINNAYERILSELDDYQETEGAQSLQRTKGSIDPSIFIPTTTNQARLSRKRSWYLGLIIVGLTTLAWIVVSQNFRRSEGPPSPVAMSSPVYESSPSPTSSPTPTPPSPPTPNAQPSRDEYGDLLDSLEFEKEAQKKSTPPIDLSAGVIESDSSPSPTPTPTPSPVARPRTESLVSAHDVLVAGITRDEDTRRYRFRLEQKARVKGRFSAQGNIRVEILGGYYSSGAAISADTIDVILEAGVYELKVSARESVAFNVRLTAYYDQ